MRPDRLGRPAVMGVLNITPDSFSDGGDCYHEHPQKRLDIVIRRAEALCEAGADILDLGGESTRPGARDVQEEEEAARILPAIKAVKKRTDLPVSVDTSKPAIMKAAAAEGADMINDVCALMRPGALEAAAESGLRVCLMHMQKKPSNMQQNPCYREVVGDIKDWLMQRVTAAEQAGIAPDRLILDPGFGFGKTLEHNLSLLRRLGEFQELGRPLLVGLSRKSMLGTLTGRANPKERVFAGIAAMLRAVSMGAAIVRTHDVAATVDALSVWCATAKSTFLEAESWHRS